MKIELTEKEIEFLKQYARVYGEERSLDCTRDPVVVVEDVEESVAADGFGDKQVYTWDMETYYSLEELRKALIENDYSENDITDMLEDVEENGHCMHNEIQKYEVYIKYRPIAYFLTRTEAERYVKYQSHNLTKPRVYTRSCGYGNRGDLQCLYQLLLKMGQQLNQ